MAARDAANRLLGTAGEDFVVRLERQRLEALGRSDLAARVVGMSREAGDGLGYDIASFAKDAEPIYIEVKTTKGSIETPFFVSENERLFAAEKGSSFVLYRLFRFGSDPKVYVVNGPLEPTIALEAVSYRARVRVASAQLV